MSFNEDVQEARSRLRRCLKGEYIDDVYPNLSWGYGPMKDQSLLATNDLREHPEDESESVSEQSNCMGGGHHLNENQILAMVSDITEDIDYDIWKEVFRNDDPDADVIVRRLVEIAIKHLTEAGVPVTRIGAA